MVSQLSRTFPIVQGPPKYDLSVSHYDGTKPRRVVVFSVEGAEDIKVAIDATQRVDGSDKNWWLAGTVIDSSGCWFVQGRYSLRGGDKGYLEFVVYPPRLVPSSEEQGRIENALLEIRLDQYVGYIRRCHETIRRLKAT